MNAGKTLNLSITTPSYTISLTIHKATGQKRKVLLFPGNTYCIKPLGSKSKRKKPRKCQLIKIYQAIDGKTYAKVRYLDTHRQGKAKIEDLTYSKNQILRKESSSN